MEDPPKKFFRLAPGREVRLRYAYFITCTDVVKDANGQGRRSCTAPTTRPRAAATPRTAARSRRRCTGSPPRTRSTAEVRLYDHLFTKPDPDDVPEGQDFTANLNPNSLETLTDCYVEPIAGGRAPLSRYQFERLGYFCVDPDSTAGKLVFNRTVTLKDTWAKIQQSQQQG